MKKLVLALLVGSVLVVGAVAQENKSTGAKKSAMETLSVDFLTNISSEKAYGFKYSAVAFGLNITWFKFSENKIVGPYYSIGFAVPISRKMEGVEYNFDFGIDLDFVVGPGFRIPISDKMRVTAGIGLHVPVTTYDFKDTLIGIGVGGTVAYNLQLTEKIMLNVGTTLAYDFLGYSLHYEETMDNYGMFKAKPFIGFAFKQKRR
jgi:hypothetical protein